MASMHEDVHQRARKQQQERPCPQDVCPVLAQNKNAAMAKKAKQKKNVRDVQKLPCGEDVSWCD